MEQNQEYWQQMPDGEGRDHYFWQRFLAPGSGLVSIFLPFVTEAPVLAGLRVTLQGRTDPPQDPDHHTRILLNGALADDQLWDGQTPFEHRVRFSQNALREGENQVGIVLVGDTGAPVDSVYLDYVEVDYVADLVASEGSLRFLGANVGAAEFRVSGFEAPGVELFDVTDPTRVVRCVGGVESGPAGDRVLSFEDAVGGHSYLALTPSAKRAPAALELDRPSDLRNAQRGADWVATFQTRNFSG